MEITKDLTIPKLFCERTRRFGRDKVAMREKEFGIWKPITWEDYLENVKYLALGLISWKAGLKEEGYSFFRESYFVYKTLGLNEEKKKLLTLLVDSAMQLGYDDDRRTYSELLQSLEE